MKTFILRALILLVLPLATTIVHAQVYPCSGPGPGQIVVGQTQGGQGVASQPLCQRVQQRQRPSLPPPEQWASQWGAIAANAQGSVIGVAANSANKDLAEQVALADCQNRGGGNTCKIVRWYANQCISIVTGGKIYNTNGGATVEEATQKGMKLCTPEAGDCHVYYSACSLPVRIQ